jgi:hypothetical protein
VISRSIIEDETAVLVLALHQRHHLLAALVQFFIGLPRVLPVAFAHLAEVLILQV